MRIDIFVLVGSPLLTPVQLGAKDGKKDWMTDHCRECKQPLGEIDNRGQHLHGCMTCNIWWTVTARKVGYQRRT